MSLVAFLLAPPLVVASITDVRFRIIPDLAVLAVAGIGLGAALTTGTLAPALAAGAAGLGLGLGFWWIGGWGLGDAKLFAAAALVAGPAGLPALILAMALSGGLMALVALLLAGPAHAVPAAAPRWVRVEARRLRLAPSIPYGIAIAAGLMAAVLIGA